MSHFNCIFMGRKKKIAKCFYQQVSHMNYFKLIYMKTSSQSCPYMHKNKEKFGMIIIGGIFHKEKFGMIIMGGIFPRTHSKILYLCSTIII